MNWKIFLLPLILFSIPITNSYAELDVFTNSNVYAPSHNLQVYGTGLPEENLILRIFSPDDTIAKFDQLTTNDDGKFNYSLLTWPEASNQFPYGTYVVEVISTSQNGISKKIDVKFSSTTDLQEVPVERIVNSLVFAPEIAAINQPIRVFVQITSDGLLVGNDATQLLGNTHVHLPSGQSITLTNSFKTLHQGLYYVDFIPNEEGTHVFHVIAFTQGTTSHGSAATNVLSQDIGGLSQQIITLNQILSDTEKEVETLKSQIDGFDRTLDRKSTRLNSSHSSVSRMPSSA